MTTLTPYERAVVEEEEEEDTGLADEIVSLGERRLITALMATGNQVKAARQSGLVPVTATDRQARNTTLRVLKKEGVTQWVDETMAAIGLTSEHILGVLMQNLGAYRIEVNSRTGEVVNLGPDTKGRNEAARILLGVITLEKGKESGKAQKTVNNQINTFAWGVEPISNAHADIVDATAYEVED